MRKLTNMHGVQEMKDVGIGAATIDAYAVRAGAMERYWRYYRICFEIHTSARRTWFDFCIAMPLIGPKYCC